MKSAETLEKAIHMSIEYYKIKPYNSSDYEVISFAGRIAEFLEPSPPLEVSK